VYLVYILVKEFEKGSSLEIRNLKLEIIAPALLAISPWHIHFSRGGWEVNTATFFILLGVTLYFKALQNKKVSTFALCALSFVLSLYTYHAARIIAPLLVLFLAFTFKDELKKSVKPVILAVLLGIILTLPLVRDLTSGEIASRAAGVGIFADPGTVEKTNEQRMEHKGVFSLVLHNKVINYGLAFLKNWGEHYHGLFLFVSGDVIQRNAVTETGQLYMFEIATVLIGLYVLFKSNLLNTKPSLLILFWLLVAPIPAALTFQSPHALRAENMVIPLTIISAIGLAAILGWIKKLKRPLFVICNLLFVILISWSLSRYLHMYYFHMSKEYPFSSQYGIKDLVTYLSGMNKDYKNIVVTNKYDQPYILFLFYTKYPPQEFQKDHILTAKDTYGFSTVPGFSNYVFKSIDWDNDKVGYPDSLIIGSDVEIPNEANIIKRICGQNGYLYFKVVEN
jgi:hypothetical protein